MHAGRRRRTDRSGESGLSLVENVFAMVILAIIALGLVAMVAASQKMTSLSAERATALGACRGYIEAMRGLAGVAAIHADRTTPADYLPAGARVVGAVGEVYKADDESGDTAARVSGTAGASNTQNAGQSFTARRASLALPRDLDADADATGGTIDPASLTILPARVRLSWTSATGGTHEVVLHAVFGQP